MQADEKFTHPYMSYLMPVSELFLSEALEKSLEIDYQIESKGSPDKKKFMEIARKEGMRKAIKFRDSRFSIDE